MKKLILLFTILTVYGVAQNPVLTDFKNGFRVGSGAAGKDYSIRIEGETNDFTALYMEDEDSLIIYSDVVLNEVRYSDTFWDDLRVEGLSVRVGGTAPEFKTIGFGGLYGLFFNNNQDDAVYFSVQLPHSYKPNSDISPHVHYMLDADGSAGQEIVWEFEYSWADYNEAFPAVDTITTYIDVAAKVDDTHYIGDFTSNISGTNKESSILVCRLARLASSDARDDYTNDIAFLYFDIHFEVEKPGSSNETPD